jgi:hypothetical protein
MFGIALCANRETISCCCLMRSLPSTGRNSASSNSPFRKLVRPDRAAHREPFSDPHRSGDRRGGMHLQAIARAVRSVPRPRERTQPHSRRGEYPESRWHLGFRQPFRPASDALHLRRAPSSPSPPTIRRDCCADVHLALVRDSTSDPLCAQTAALEAPQLRT